MKSGDQRVLIFDDDPLVGKSLANMVAHLEMTPLAVTEPQAFFAAVSNWQPTHLILDLIMPLMDGVEVLQHLSRANPNCPIALLSGANSRILKAAQRSGGEHGLKITHVLQKPLTVSALEEFLMTNLSPSRTDHVSEHQSKNLIQPVIEQELRTAIEERQFFLNYQPIIHCNSSMLKGFETLVRWQHPTRGLVAPDQFIPVAEELGLIDDMTHLIVDSAFDWFAGTSRFPDLSLSINISAKTFSNVRFPDQLGAIARTYGISPETVILEVTETAAMDDQLQALDLFTRLRVKGFQVSIDDFGIGNSSLLLLARLPFSEIKVDKTFAISANESDEARTIIRSTVDLSHNLGLSVVTEGVEDQPTLEFLRSIGCDYAQGYHIARPMLGDQALEWIVRSPR